MGKALKNNNIKRYQNKYIHRIRERIYDILRKTKKIGVSGEKVVIGWKPGHKGIVGNEIADTVAKESTEEFRDERIKVPVDDWSRIYEEEMEIRTRNRIEIEGRSKGVKFFEKYYRKEMKKVWFKDMDEPRGLGTMINRLRANYYNLNESLERKGYIDDKRYECGGEEQDMYYVIFSCVEHDDDRCKKYREFQRLNVEYSYEIDRWLKYTVIPPLKEV